MKNKFKRFLSLAMALVMVIGMMPHAILGVSATEATSVEHTYTVAGDSGLCGAVWDTTYTANDMTLQSDGTYTKVFKNVPAGTYAYKVVEDHSWVNCWGDVDDSDAKAVVETAGSTVTISFTPYVSYPTATVEVPAGECAHEYEYECSTHCMLCGQGEREATHFGDLPSFPEGKNCTTDCTVTYACIDCGYSYEEEWGATDHIFSDGYCIVCYEEDPAPECEHYEHNQDGFCTNCGEEVGHTYVDGVCQCGKTESTATVEVSFATGEGSHVDSQTLNAGDTVLEPTVDPTREGYDFGGWYTDEDCTEEFDFDTAVTSDLTLYAKWVLKSTDTGYALFGWINGANYGCEEDVKNIGEYIFVDGKLTVTFTSDSYVAVKTTDNATWYMIDGWAGDATSVTLYDITLLHTTWEKLMVPGGVELTFTLVENADGTLTLSYSDGSEDEEPTEPAYETRTIYFQNNWLWSDVNIYFWDSETAENPAYPGIAMELAGNDGTYDIYKYEVPADVKGFLFNGLKDDGSGNRDQSPDITEGFYNGICYYMLWESGNKVGSEDISVILPGTEVKPDPTPDPEPDPEPDPDAFIIYFDPNGVAYESLEVHSDICAHVLESGVRKSLQWDEELVLWVSEDLSDLICNECEPTFKISTDANAQNVLVNGILEKGKTYVGPADPNAFIVYFDPNGVEYESIYIHPDNCAHVDINGPEILEWDARKELWVNSDLSDRACDECEITFDISTDYHALNILMSGVLENGKTYVGPAPTISADDVQNAFTVHVQADCGGLTGKHSDFVQLGEVTENDGVYTCVVTIQAKDFAESNTVDFDILWPDCAPHSADPENPETIEVTLTWDAENQEWTAAEEDQHIYVYILCAESALTISADDVQKALTVDAQADCDRIGGDYADFVQLGEVTENDGVYTCVVTIKAKDFAEYMSVDFDFLYSECAPHSADPENPETIEVTLTWDAENQEWTAAEEDQHIFVYILCTDNSPQPSETITIYLNDYSPLYPEDDYHCCAPSEEYPLVLSFCDEDGSSQKTYENGEQISEYIWKFVVDAADLEQYRQLKFDAEYGMGIVDCPEADGMILSYDVDEEPFVWMRYADDTYPRPGGTTDPEGTIIVYFDSGDADWTDVVAMYGQSTDEDGTTAEMTPLADGRWSVRIPADSKIIMFGGFVDGEPRMTDILEVKAGRTYYADGTFEDGTDGPVASIGDETFNTLEAALKAAESGDVIKLLSDDCSNETDIPEGAVLDLNGHKLILTETPFTGRISFNGGLIVPADAPAMEMFGPNGRIMKTTDGIIDLSAQRMTLAGGTFTMGDSGVIFTIAGTAKLIVPDDHPHDVSCTLNSPDASIVGPADMDVVTERAGYEVVCANGTYTLALSDEAVKIYIKYYNEPVIPGLTDADVDGLYYVEVTAGEDLVLTMPEAKGVFVLEAYNAEDDSYTTTNSKADGTVAMPWEVISDEGLEHLWLSHYPNKVTVNLNGGSLSDDTMVWFYDYGGELAEDGKSATMYYPTSGWIILEDELEWGTFVKEGCTLTGFRLNGGTEIVDRCECVDGLVVDLVWEITKPEPFSFYGTNLNLGTDLDLKFAFAMDHVENWDGYYAEMIRTYGDGRDDHVVHVDSEDWDVCGAYYVVAYEGFAAKEMCDIVYVTIYDPDGNAVSVSMSDCIQSYALRAFDDDPAVKTLAVDLLNYGAAAQVRFGYNTDDLANSVLTADHQQYASDLDEICDVHVIDKTKVLGANLNIKSNICFRIAFKNITEGMYAKVEYTNHNRKLIEETHLFADMEESVAGNGAVFHIVNIRSMVVADSACPVTVTMYNADGTVYTTYVDSIQSYALRGMNDTEWGIFEEFVKFANSAWRYLHRNEK